MSRARGKRRADVDPPDYAIQVVTGEIDQEQQARALRTLMSTSAPAAKRRKIDKRVQDFVQGDFEKKKKIIKEEIDAARDKQRAELVHQLTDVCNQAQVAEDLEALAKEVKKHKPVHKCTEQVENERRKEWLHAIKVMIEQDWPSLPGEQESLCAYDGLLVACGIDEYYAYLQDAAKLRVAQQALFDSEKICHTIDTALLCFSHETCRTYREHLSFYEYFEYFTSIFIDYSTMTGPLLEGMRDIMSSKRKEDDRPPKPIWGWGNVRGRIACKEFFRVVEANLMHINAGWDKVQSEQPFKDILSETLIGDVTGSGFMEQFEGELATEMIYILHRVFTGTGTSDKPNKDIRMPPIPNGPAPRKGYTYKNNFEVSADATPKERARAYVYRTMYTSLQQSWLLHSPIAPALFCSLFQSSGTAGFEMRSSLDEDDIRKALDAPSEYEQKMASHHRLLNSIANGTQEVMQDEVYKEFKTNHDKLVGNMPEPQKGLKGKAIALKAFGHFGTFLGKFTPDSWLMRGILGWVLIDVTCMVIVPEGTAIITHTVNGPVWRLLKPLIGLLTRNFPGVNATLQDTLGLTVLEMGTTSLKFVFESAGNATTAAVGAMAPESVLKIYNGINNAWMAISSGGRVVMESAGSATGNVTAAALTAYNTTRGMVSVESLTNLAQTTQHMMFGNGTVSNNNGVHGYNSTALASLGAYSGLINRNFSNYKELHEQETRRMLENSKQTRQVTEALQNQDAVRVMKNFNPMWVESQLQRLSESANALPPPPNQLPGTYPNLQRLPYVLPTGEAASVSAVTKDLEARLDLVAPRPLLSATTTIRRHVREPTTTPRLFCLPEANF